MSWRTALQHRRCGHFDPQPIGGCASVWPSLGPIDRGECQSDGDCVWNATDSAFLPRVGQERTRNTRGSFTFPLEFGQYVDSLRYHVHLSTITLTLWWHRILSASSVFPFTVCNFSFNWKQEISISYDSERLVVLVATICWYIISAVSVRRVNSIIYLTLYQELLCIQGSFPRGKFNAFVLMSLFLLSCDS